MKLIKHGKYLLVGSILYIVIGLTMDSVLHIKDVKVYAFIFYLLGGIIGIEYANEYK